MAAVTNIWSIWCSSLEVVADPSPPLAQPERKQPARPPSLQHETTELTKKQNNVQMKSERLVVRSSQTTKLT